MSALRFLQSLREDTGRLASFYEFIEDVKRKQQNRLAGQPDANSLLILQGIVKGVELVAIEVKRELGITEKRRKPT